MQEVITKPNLDFILDTVASHTNGTKSPSLNKKINRNPHARVYSTYRTVGTTCPDSCSLLGVCYASQGNVRIQQAKAALKTLDVYKYITELPENAIVRHLVSGDLLLNGAVDWNYINGMVEGHRARPDVRGWGYTHAWGRLRPEDVNLPNLTFNASCDTDAEVVAALEAGWFAVTVVPADFPHKILETENYRLVVCLEQLYDTPCAECMLCFSKKRNLKAKPTVIGFKAHGAKNLVAARLKDRAAAEEAERLLDAA